MTGGFADDFSSSTVVAVDRDGCRDGAGAGLRRSRASSFWDPVRDETLVLDFGVIGDHGDLP